MENKFENKADKTKEQEFNEWYSKNGHWVTEEDIKKWELEIDENAELYHCREDGSCKFGHTTYTHPEFGGIFHEISDDCSVQNPKEEE